MDISRVIFNTLLIEQFYGIKNKQSQLIKLQPASTIIFSSQILLL